MVVTEEGTENSPRPDQQVSDQHQNNNKTN